MESSAARNRDQKEKVVLSKEERLELYSFLVSFVFHTILLLCLALLWETPKATKHLIVHLSFSSASDTIQPDLETESVNIAELMEESASTSGPQIHETFAVQEEETEISLDINTTTIEYTNNTHLEPLFGKDISLPDLLATAKTIPISPTKNISQKVDNRPDMDILAELVKATNAGLIAQNQQSNAQNFTRPGIGERLKSAGAQTGEVQMSISWDTVDDIDLHVVANINGQLDPINWTRRVGASGGMLDIDMNANNPPLVNQPVENIFWPKGSSPRGSFSVGVHFFRSWTGNRQVPVIVRVKYGENIETFNIIAVLGKNVQQVTRFNY